MKCLSFVLVMMMSLGTTWALAGETHEKLLTSTQENTLASAAVDVGNKTCPVSGEEIGEMGEVTRYEYNGKIYNLCCAMCIKDFQKNPEQYSNKAEESIGIQNNKHRGCGCSSGQSCKG